MEKQERDCKGRDYERNDCFYHESAESENGCCEEIFFFLDSTHVAEQGEQDEEEEQGIHEDRVVHVNHERVECEYCRGYERKLVVIVKLAHELEEQKNAGCAKKNRREAVCEFYWKRKGEEQRGGRRQDVKWKSWAPCKFLPKKSGKQSLVRLHFIRHKRVEVFVLEEWYCSYEGKAQQEVEDENYCEPLPS